MKKKTWVIIAAYNEERYIGNVIQGVKEFCKNIVVVDDGSKDKTASIAKNNKAHVLRHKTNQGKGVAVKTGCDHALKKGAEILILIDADGQHEPKEIPRFLKKLKGKDIVFGYRKLVGEMPLVFRFGNWFINLTARILFGMNLKDTQSGYRALTADAYKKVKWKATGYPMESEMIANAGKHKLKYSEVSIRTIYADKNKGTTVLDGIKIVLSMIKYKFLGRNE